VTAGAKLTAVLAAMICGSVSTACLSAAEPAEPTKPTKPAEKRRVPEELLDDVDRLIGDLEKDLDDEPVDAQPDPPTPDSPSPNPPSPVPPSPDGETPNNPAVKPPAGEDIGQPREHPLRHIAGKMKDVQSRLRADKDTSKRTQLLQDQVVKEIDRLLSMLKQGAPQDGGSTSPAPAASDASPAGDQRKPQKSDRRPRDSSDDVRDPEESMPDVEDRGELIGRSWGELPPKLRETLIGRRPQRFLAQYRAVIEDYFRRLAEESASP